MFNKDYEKLNREIFAYVLEEQDKVNKILAEVKKTFLKNVEDTIAKMLTGVVGERLLPVLNKEDIERMISVFEQKYPLELTSIEIDRVDISQMGGPSKSMVKTVNLVFNHGRGTKRTRGEEEVARSKKQPSDPRQFGG